MDSYYSQKPESFWSIFKTFIQDRKKAFFLLLFFALIYLLIKGMSKASAAFLAFELGLIFIFVGMAPAYYLRNIFPFRNIVGWLTNASVFSLIFIPVIFLVFGWANINFVFLHSINLLRLLAVISVFIFILCIKKEELEEFVSISGLNVIDFIFYGVIIGFTAILTLQNMTNYFPRWDVFTYWGLDAKYIFNFNALHDLELDVFWFFSKESSFLTILYSLIYDLYGKVVEQFASWINVFVTFVSMLLVYNLSNGRSALRKLLVVTALVAVGFTADDTAYTFSLYGDTFSAFLFLVFVLVLTADFKFRKENYGIRLLILLLIPLCLYFIKSRFLFLTVSLPIVAIIYDFQLLRSKWKDIAGKPAFIICLLVITSLCALFINYQNVVMGGYSLETGVSTFLYSSKNSLRSYFSYTKELVFYLINFSRYLTVLWLLAMITISFEKRPLMNKKYSYSYVLTFLGFLIFIIAYINRQAVLSSGSLIRYTSLVMFLAPLLFVYPEFRIPQKMLGEKLNIKDGSFLRNLFLSALVFGVGCLFNNKVKQVAPVNQNFSFVGGAYSDILSYHASLAKKVSSIAEADARILIADDFLESNRVMNQNQTSIFVRYFLMNNSVGGQYRTTINQTIPLAKRFNADYLLLLSYENIFPNCENVMEGGKDYLIRLGEDLTPGSDVCAFPANSIYNLTDN